MASVPVAQGGDEVQGVVVDVGQVDVVTAPVAVPERPVIALQDRIKHMVAELALPTEYVEDLLRLVGTDIVVIADDSGSMNTISDTTNPFPATRRADRADSPPPERTALWEKRYEPTTRWVELRNTLKMLVTMLLVIEHSDGFWLKFLNDPLWYKVASSEQLESIFVNKPKASGRTPLLANLEPVLQGYGCEENDTLILLMTDGEPSDCSFDELGQLIKSKAQDVYLSVAMCTEEDDIVEMYNNTIDPIHGCDITDDFVSEKKEAAAFGNVLTPYSWLAKMLLVKFEKYDKLDERPLRPGSGGCCVVS